MTKNIGLLLSETAIPNALKGYPIAIVNPVERKKVLRITLWASIINSHWMQEARLRSLKCDKQAAHNILNQ